MDCCNRIDKKFFNAKKLSKKVFLIYITAGYPNLKITEELILGFSKIGVDIVELGVPFSDPIADGPTIQKASKEALDNNVNLSKIFKIVRKIRNKTEIGLIIMTYYNVIYQYGLKRFIADCKKVGIDGIIIPDLIPEESKYLVKLSKKHNVRLIFLLAPTSSLDRIKLVSKYSNGFIYCVSLTGVTGERSNLPEIRDYINKVRRHTDKPIAVGFGVSKSYQVKKVLKYADGVIIGSAVIKEIERNINKKNLVENVLKFVSKLKEERERVNKVKKKRLSYV